MAYSNAKKYLFFLELLTGHVRQFILVAIVTSPPLFSGVNHETMTFRGRGVYKHSSRFKSSL